MQVRSYVERRSLLRLVGVTGAVLALGVASGGCGSSDDSGTASKSSNASTGGGEKQAKIAYFTLQLQNPYVSAALEGIESVAAERNASVQVFDANLDAQKQGTQIQDAITGGGFDAFVILPVDGTITPEVKQAVKAGIAIASNNIPLGPGLGSEVQIPGVVASVMEDPTTDGEHLGNAAVEACADKDPCNVVEIGGFATLALDKAKFDAIDALFKQHPSIKIVGRGEGQYQESGGEKAMQDLLQANPKIDVLIANGDGMGMGAERAITAAGRQNEIKIISSGSSRQGVARVKSGKWLATTMYLPRTEAEVATNLVLDKVNGKPVKMGEFIDPAAKSKIGPVVTKETLAKDPAFVGEWDA
jgi:ribose transport system substrate-binding protein